MRLTQGTANPATLLRVSTLAFVLLAIRFSASTILVSTDLPAETLASVGEGLEVYDRVLPAVLLAILVLLAFTRGHLRPMWSTAGVLAFHAVALVVWILSLDPTGPPAGKAAYPFLAIGAVAAAPALAIGLTPGALARPRTWQEWSFAILLFLVPAVFVLRVAAALGVGTGSGAEGTLQGNWLLVYMPTLILILFSIGVWSNLVIEPRPSEGRRTWVAFLPLAFIPLAAVAFTVRPLAGYILSAFITWGSNLALFVPAPLSLTLSVAAAACFFSSFMLMDRRENRQAWQLLFLGSSCIVLAGFYMSMASVEGLTLALFFVTLSRSPRNGTPR